MARARAWCGRRRQLSRCWSTLQPLQRQYHGKTSLQRAWVEFLILVYSRCVDVSHILIKILVLIYGLFIFLWVILSVGISSFYCFIQGVLLHLFGGKGGYVGGYGFHVVGLYSVYFKSVNLISFWLISLL